MTKFSVVIPTYNRAATITRAIESVLAQTYPYVEIILINDGSTDNTEELIKVYRDRIKYISQHNRGSASARNRGISEATGDYIAFLDSDDLWFPKKLERVVVAIQNYPEVGLFYSDSNVLDKNGRLMWIYRSSHIIGNAYQAFMESDFVSTSSVVVHRSCFDVVGVFSESLAGCEDWDMWIRLSRKFPCVHIPEVLSAFAWRTGGARSTDPGSWLEGVEEVLQRAFEADPGLSLHYRKRARARTYYVEGKINLWCGNEAEALKCFQRSVVTDQTVYKAYLYLTILGSPWLKRWLPHRIRRMLKLPEDYTSNESVY
jgi:glycosyltransferase involved in cell wall biosynthesis